MNTEEQNDFSVRSSNNLWAGITVTDYVIPSTMLGNQQLEGHRVAFNAGEPVKVRCKEGNVWQDKIYECGSFGIVPHGEYNDISWNNELHATVISFKPEFTEQIFEADKIKINPRRGIKDRVAYELTALLKYELGHENLAGKILGDSLAVAFATHLVTNYADMPAQVFAPKGKLSAKQLKHVIEYCNDLDGDAISLENMSEMACLSIFHFIRMFKKSLGITPYQYVLQLKVEKATRLLKQQDISLSKIAHTLGFTDQAHFSNVFKKATGFSPKKIQ